MKMLVGSLGKRIMGAGLSLLLAACAKQEGGAGATGWPNKEKGPAPTPPSEENTPKEIGFFFLASLRALDPTVRDDLIEGFTLSLRGCSSSRIVYEQLKTGGEEKIGGYPLKINDPFCYVAIEKFKYNGVTYFPLMDFDYLDVVKDDFSGFNQDDLSKIKPAVFFSERDRGDLIRVGALKKLTYAGISLDDGVSFGLYGKENLRVVRSSHVNRPDFLAVEMAPLSLKSGAIFFKEFIPNVAGEGAARYEIEMICGEASPEAPTGDGLVKIGGDFYCQGHPLKGYEAFAFDDQLTGGGRFSSFSMLEMTAYLDETLGLRLPDGVLSASDTPGASSKIILSIDKKGRLFEEIDGGQHVLVVRKKDEALLLPYSYQIFLIESQD